MKSVPVKKLFALFALLLAPVPAHADISGGGWPARAPGRYGDPAFYGPPSWFEIAAPFALWGCGLACLVKWGMLVRQAVKNPALRKAHILDASAFGVLGVALGLAPFILANNMTLLPPLAFSALGLFWYLRRRAKAAAKK